MWSEDNRIWYDDEDSAGIVPLNCPHCGIVECDCEDDWDPYANGWLLEAEA